MTPAAFKAIRVELGCTGEAFARALGYGGSAQSLKTRVYKFETGRCEIPPAIARLATMLGIHGIPSEPLFDGGGMIVEVFEHAPLKTVVYKFENAKKRHRAKRRRAKRNVT
jgi:transcriptional regulator with XRE-family HTH domain